MNPRPLPCEGIKKIPDERVADLLEIRSLSGISERVFQAVKRMIYHYLEYVDYTINKRKTLQYFKKLKEKHSVSYYRKQVYQILKFLRYLDVKWTEEIQLPPEPTYYPKHVSKEDINSTLHYFERDEYELRFKAIINLGMDSGLRAEELYQLNVEDLDLENGRVRVNHDPNNGQSTKTKQNRISFFFFFTKKVLNEYLAYFDTNNNLTKLFPKRWLEGKFRNTPIRIKHLRKYFSQEWDRRGGPTSIKKILMGHSLKGDVDLMHYNSQSEEDLKRIYDRVMNQ